MKLKKKFVLEIILTIATGIIGYLFFYSYSQILTTAKLFSSDEIYIIITIAAPIICFSLALCFLTIDVLVFRNYYPAVVLPVVFIISQKFTLISISSGILMFIGFVIFIKFFKDKLIEFKKPVLAPSMRFSLGVCLTILSIVIAINFYPYYYKIVSQQEISTSNSVISQLALSFRNRYFDTIEYQKNETLQSYSTNVLKNQNKPVTENNIKNEENIILNNLGVSGKENETMSTISIRAFVKQFNQFISTYKSQILIFVPLAFFFISQTFTTISSWFAFYILSIIDFILKRKGLDLIKQTESL